MEDGFAGAANGRSKAQELADVINRLLQTLVTRCAQGEDVHDYFEIGAIGYGEAVGPALRGPLAGRDFVPISEIAFNPALLEQRTRKIPDGEGGFLDESYQFPVWLDPVHTGGTPMCEALRRTKAALERWVAAHPHSYPPTVVHITDGESTDGEPFAIASEIRDAGDGRRPGVPLQPAPLVVGRQAGHVSECRIRPAGRVRADSLRHVEPPARATSVTRLVRGVHGHRQRRGFAFNADLVETIRFIDIGTRVAGVR